MTPAVRPAREEDAAEIVETLVEAFQDDPFAAWLHHDPVERCAAHRRMFAALLREPPAGAHVHVTADLSAAAVWLPPSTRPDLGAGPGARGDVTRLFAELEAATPAPAWYLAFIGARRPGGGSGSALLRHGLDPLRGPARLWTGNPANVAFYARFGFRETSRHRAGDACCTWLLRP